MARSRPAYQAAPLTRQAPDGTRREMNPNGSETDLILRIHFLQKGTFCSVFLPFKTHKLLPSNKSQTDISQTSNFFITLESRSALRVTEGYTLGTNCVHNPHTCEWRFVPGYWRVVLVQYVVPLYRGH